MSSNVPPTFAVISTGGNQNPNQPARELILLNADGSAASTVKKQAAQADSVASTVAGVVVDLNLLLAKLRLAGVIS